MDPSVMSSDGFGRLIIVSNRLPISGKKTDDGGWSFTKSSGGLVTALSGIQHTKFIWVGWPGLDITDPGEEHSLRETLRSDYDCEPVMLSSALVEKYYDGFSNSILWPLFHYMPEDVHFDIGQYNAYVDVNKKFADTIYEIYRPGDILWIHDYHLMLLPNFVRERIPEAHIGFFLHIPFPSSEIYKVLPKGRELLDGVLNSDLVGFHTFEYSRHFLKTCTRLLGVENTVEGVNYQGRFVNVRVNPVGIDPSKFYEHLKTEQVKTRIEELRSTFQGRKIILGVDRLDYIKGVPHKLRGLEKFFQDHPEWIGKVVLIQIAVPSRISVKEYQDLKHEVEELVGRINGKYGSLSFNPIHYLFSSVDFTELAALYSISDAVLVTSIRDGMNLVAEEYVVCQHKNHGVLILSEFAGAAGALSGSLIINPWDTRMVSDAIHKALTLSPDDRLRRHKELARFVDTHTAQYWAETFVKDLKSAIIKSQSASVSHSLSEKREQFLADYVKAQGRRLLVFELDALLSNFAARNKSMTATRSGSSVIIPPEEGLMTCLQNLCSDPTNLLVIHSSNDKLAIQEWFDGFPTSNLILSAEDGFFIRPLDSDTWKRLMPEIDDVSWRDSVKPVFQYFQERTPGSQIEERESQLIWDFRDADKDFGASQANEMLIHLDSLYAKMPIEVTVRNMVVQVKPLGMNLRPVFKEAVAKLGRWSSKEEETAREDNGEVLVLVCGSDYSLSQIQPGDLEEQAWTVYKCAVGNRSAAAEYFVPFTTHLMALLNQAHVRS